MKIFDRKFHFQQLRRSDNKIYEHDFIHKYASEQIYERLTILDKTFDTALILGYLSCNIKKFSNNVNQYRYEEYDEEFLPGLNNSDNLNNSDKKYDLIISILSLHYVNNPQDSLISYRHLLNKGGIFIGMFFGGRTLNELRISLQEAELSLSFGVSPRVIPMIDVKDATRLMQIAGFNTQVADVDTIEVKYLTLDTLLHDLKGIGQSNALMLRNKKYPGRDFFKVTEEYYRRKFLENNRLTATFDIITVTGTLHC
jgi:NADH dehydrogenase [ubiquinone] 1 alpha subcomplex assembly factor 5